MGLWNDGVGWSSATLSFAVLTLSLQELFTRKRPFHYLPRDAAIVLHIVYLEIQRSKLDPSSHLTDGWWNICLLCWDRDASQRPVISDIAGHIKALLQTTCARIVRAISAI